MGTNHQQFWPQVLRHAPRRSAATTTYLVVTDRLHDGRRVHVPAREIGSTVSAWLAELGAHSPLVGDLARAIDSADWPTARAIGEYLAIDVAVAA